MRWSLVLVVLILSRCGGVASEPPRHALPVAAAVEPAVVATYQHAPDETCEAGAITMMVVDGREARARLVECVSVEEEHSTVGVDEELVTWRDWHADLVLDRPGGAVATTLGKWTTGLSDHTRWTVIGTLASASGETAMMVQMDHGETDRMRGPSDAQLLVMAARGGRWDKVYEVKADRLIVSRAPDGREAVVAGVTYHQDDLWLIRLAWDGKNVQQR